MLTVVALPKPFVGDADRDQNVALQSWRHLGGGVQIVLVGDEVGVAEAAVRVGAEQVKEVARSSRGTPRLDDALARVDVIARHPLRLLVNADVVLLGDLLTAVSAVRDRGPFLLVGQSRELRVDPSELDDPASLRRRALVEGVLRGPTAIDWFVFPRGHFDPLPPFLIGRASFDNWLIWRGRQAGPVIDATHDVVAVHQPHGYGHLRDGKAEAYYGNEARLNLELGGGTRRRYTLHDASHRLVDGRLRRNPGSILRGREIARILAWKLGRGRP